MREYELMTIFPLEEDLSKAALEAVRATLTEFGAEITEEKPFGDRDLTYEIQKRKKGRFILFTMKLNPSKVVEIDRQFKLQSNLLKYMFVRIDD